MTSREPVTFLRRVLFADAAISGASALAMLAGANLAARPLGLPPALLMAAGASLLPFTLGVLWLAARPRTPRGGVWLVAGPAALPLPAGHDDRGGDAASRSRPERSRG